MSNQREGLTVVPPRRAIAGKLRCMVQFVSELILRRLLAAARRVPTACAQEKGPGEFSSHYSRPARLVKPSSGYDRCGPLHLRDEYEEVAESYDQDHQQDQSWGHVLTLCRIDRTPADRVRDVAVDWRSSGAPNAERSSICDPPCLGYLSARSMRLVPRRCGLALSAL